MLWSASGEKPLYFIFCVNVPSILEVFFVNFGFILDPFLASFWRLRAHFDTIFG